MLLNPRDIIVGIHCIPSVLQKTSKRNPSKELTLLSLFVLVIHVFKHPYLCKIFSLKVIVLAPKICVESIIYEPRLQTLPGATTASQPTSLISSMFELPTLDPCYSQFGDTNWIMRDWGEVDLDPDLLVCNSEMVCSGYWNTVWIHI